MSWINEWLTGGLQPTRCGRIAVALPVGSWLDQPAAQVRTAGVTPTIAAAAVSLPTTFSGDPADRPIYTTAVEQGGRWSPKTSGLREHRHPRKITIW